MSAPRGRTTERGDDAAADELTSRTVKVAVRFDEHSARCVARSRARPLRKPTADRTSDPENRPENRPGKPERSAGPGTGLGDPAPARHEAARGILHGHRITEMVAPGAVNMQAAAAQPLFPEPQFLHHPAAGVILRPDGGLDPVQADDKWPWPERSGLCPGPRRPRQSSSRPAPTAPTPR
jgi:hypothetical protein